MASGGWFSQTQSVERGSHSTRRKYHHQEAPEASGSMSPVGLSNGLVPKEPKETAAIPKLDSPDTPKDITFLVAEAEDCLHRHHLDNAESGYQKALLLLDDGTFKGQEKIFIQALSGLAEVHCKKGRRHRGDDMEWHHQMMRSAALQLEVIDICKDLQENCTDMDEREKRKWYWVEDFHKKSSQHLQVMDKLLLESFQDRIATGLKPTDDASPASLFVDTCWLKKLETYIQQVATIGKDQAGVTVQDEQGACDDVESVSSGSDAGCSKDGQNKQQVGKKVNYERVQGAIMKLVRQISTDMRQRYVRKKLPEEMFRSTVSSEMIAHFAPMPDSRDILSLFEDAIIQYKYGMSREEYKDLDFESSDMDSEGTGNETMSTDTMSDDQNQASPGMEDQEDSWPEDEKIFIPLDEEDSFKLTGVLTVWRAYNKKHGAHVHVPRLPHFKPYLLQGFEELSPLTETVLTSTEHYYVSQDTPSVHSLDSSHKESITRSSSSLSSTSNKSPENYLTEHKLKHTLAMTLVKCARQLQKDDSSLSQACELYKYSLGMLKKEPLEVKGQQELIAHVLKNLGIIRCSQGNMSIGSQLMHEALELYSPNDNVDNLQVAEVWFELGDAYMRDHWKDDTISEHVMKLVKDELDRDIRPDGDEDGPPDDASVDSDYSDEEEESYYVCAHEAMGCYKSALSILSKLRKRKEAHTSLYVDVLTKLGDCSIVVGEYERAVLCFEEALYLCQNTLGSVSLTNSAHILSMLATTNFLLGTYSKAATMYQTAHILQQHLYGLDDNFEMAFTLTMQGLTYFEMKLFHKCIAMCIKAFELYVNIYKQEIISVDPLNRWFIAQTLYCLGHSYSTINLNDKALHNLDLAKNMIDKGSEEDRDICQQVKILKSTADIYASLEMNATSLEYYQQALDQSLKLGDQQSATTLQNQLLNRMAGVHVSTKEYGAAAEYLEQALDCQKNVETSIKGDLIGILSQLGMTYILSGDLDRAIDCFNDCNEAYEEAEVAPGPEIAKILGNLGTLYHVKGCMQDDNDDMMEYLESSDKYYRDATEMDEESCVCLYYANFLHQQEQYADALLVMLPYVFLSKVPRDKDIHYNGPEQAVLPEHLLYDLNDTDEVSLETMVFAKFLGTLCLKQLNLMKDAEDCLISMMTIVSTSKLAINHTMLGYSMLEMDLYLEAAESFHMAASLQQDNEMAIINQWISIVLWTYTILSKGLYHIWEHVTESYIDLSTPATTPTPSVPVLLTLPMRETHTLRDSGYYDHHEGLHLGSATSISMKHLTGDGGDRGYSSTDNLPQDTFIVEDTNHEYGYDEWHTEEVVETPSHLLDAILQSQQEYCDQNTSEEIFESSSSFLDFTSPHTEELPEEWITEDEVTLETPSAILAALTNKQAMEDNIRQQTHHYNELDELQHKYSAYSQRFDSEEAGDPYKDAALPEEADTEEGWVTVEETIETPADILFALQNNNLQSSNDNLQTEHGHHTDSNGNGTSYLKSEHSQFSIDIMDEPADPIDQTLSLHYDGLNANSPKKIKNARSLEQLEQQQEVEEEEEWKVWETTDEVDTPSELLQAILANQQKL